VYKKVDSMDKKKLFGISEQLKIITVLQAVAEAAERLSA
jgi:hypothetical protein